MHVGVDLYPPYTWYWPDNMPVRSVGDYVPPAGRIAGRHYDEFGRLMFPDSHYQQHP